MSSLFDLPFEDEPLDPEDLQPLEREAVSPDAACRTSPAPTPVVGRTPIADVRGDASGPDVAASGPDVAAGLVRRPAEDAERPTSPGDSAAIPNRPRPHVYSVTELTHAVRHSLEHQFPRVWVEGEVADCSVNQGHIYFTLKDGGSQLPAVFWRTDAVRLRFKLTTGLHVLVQGRLSVYVPRGRYQLIADSIEPRGEGALQLAFEQLKRRLHAEGLFAATRKRAIPMLPRRIGIVTSLEGAALRDMLRVLRTRRAPAEIIISPTRVQGDGAAAEIAHAIRRVARVRDVDVIIVGRGGGSIEDLWAFNEEVVARTIAASPVPVISGVGHEVDTTIADFVADVRAATPSQAAELVVRQASEFRDRIAGARRQLVLLLRSRLDRQRTRLLRIEQRPAFARFRDLVFDRDRERAELAERLTTALRARVEGHGRRLDDLARRLEEQHPQRQLTARLRRLTQLDERLHSEIQQTREFARTALQARRERLGRVGLDVRVGQAGRRVDQQLVRAYAALTQARHARDRQLSSLSAQLDALSPLRTLARGYAICWETPGTEVVRSVTAVAAGDRVHVQLPDGMLHCEVEGADVDPSSRP